MQTEVQAITDEYARQIVEACRKLDDDTKLPFVTELLQEFGAKAYQQGRKHFAAQVIKLV